MLGGCARDPGGSASGTTPFFLHYSQKTAFNLLVWTPVLQKSVLHLLLLFRLCPTTPAWIPLLLDRTLLLHQHPKNSRFGLCFSWIKLGDPWGFDTNH